MNSFEQLDIAGIIPLKSVDEIFSLSDSVIEPALRARDAALARDTVRAIAGVLRNIGYINTALADSFIERSDQRITDLESLHSFENFAYTNFNFVNERNTLPFTDRDDIDDVVCKITSSIKPGGLFVGQLFGVDDEWNTADTKLSFHERSDIERYFTDFEALQIHEVNEDEVMANGNSKHWHVFNIIARK